MMSGGHTALYKIPRPSDRRRRGNAEQIYAVFKGVTLLLHPVSASSSVLSCYLDLVEL